MKRFTLTENESVEMNIWRSGVVRTPHGEVRTPFFMPDATRASVRGLTPRDIEESGIEALVVNTYHLFLQPGEKLVREASGIHSFMNWSHPILSDSGGYQVYSLIHKNPELGRITEEGAEFRSVLDGTKRLLTPEDSIRIQFDLGVDMMVVLDDPRPNNVSDAEIVSSVDRTLRWAKRCLEEFDAQVHSRGLTEDTRPLLFGVVQGGTLISERKRCAEGLAAIGFDGYGFGGRHVDANGEFMDEVVRATASYIPEKSIRFALGIGTPKDIVRCHAVGWDMFDCVIPTREGRHGRLFVWNVEDISSLAGNQQSLLDTEFYTTLNITNGKYKSDLSPIDKHCDCIACTRYTRAYVRHLFAVGEPLAQRLASTHNLRFFARLMDLLRA